jgi:hypothetical protein
MKRKIKSINELEKEISLLSSKKINIERRRIALSKIRSLKFQTSKLGRFSKNISSARSSITNAQTRNKKRSQRFGNFSRNISDNIDDVLGGF